MAPFHPFEVTIPHLTYAVLGGFVVIFGMFSLILRERLYIGEACWAFIFGVIIGPHGADIFNPHRWGDETAVNTITLEFTRVVLAIGVFAIGVELPKQYMKKHWKSLAFLLGPIMTYGWFVSAALIYALIPPLNFLSSLAVAACLTPTDPILAAAIIGGKYADKHVPAHIRHLLAAESGCNDGAAFPFLFLALYLIMDKTTGIAIKDWFLILWLYQIVLGSVIGAVVGYGFRHLMKFGERHDLIDRHSYVAQYVSLALFTLGVTVLLGSDDLLATFACGTAFAWDGFFNRQTEESMFSSVIDLLFNIATFIYLGAWMPFENFDDPETGIKVWRLVVIAILVLLLRRLPVMIAFYKWMPDIKTFREAVFSGHFGPMGVGAIFIATLATEILEEHAHDSGEVPHQTEILTKALQPIVAFMVLCSVTVHGLSIPFFSLGRRVHSVSRTWSRHAAPDWTNQVQPVVRGNADIVVNRDSTMEKGEVASTDLTMERQPSSTETTTTLNGEKKRNGEMTEDEKREVPPDGEEILAEWDEGPHTIIERRAGPGEEVQVEVIRNDNGSSLEAMASKFFHGDRSAVRHELQHYLSHFHHHHASEAEHHAQHGVERVEHAATEVGDAVREILPPITTFTSPHDEGAWTPDDEGSRTPAGGSSASPSPSTSRRPSLSKKRRPRTASLSSSTAPRFPNPRQGRRAPIHRASSSQDEPRGRPSTAPSPYSSLRNLRLESLRSDDRREASPVRSIRFIDESHEAMVHTPTEIEGSSSANGNNGSPSEGREDSRDSYKVTFELPQTK